MNREIKILLGLVLLSMSVLVMCSCYEYNKIKTFQMNTVEIKVQEPVNKIEKLQCNNIKDQDEDQDVEQDEEVQFVIEGEISAYTVGDGLTPSTTMASGKEVYVGAVANNMLPLGTRVRINGNIYVVEDRTGMDSNVFDIYMDSYDECIEFGRQYMDVEVLK